MVGGRRYTGSTGETGPYKAAQVEAEKKAAARRGELQHGVRKIPRLGVFSQDFLAFVRKASAAGHRAEKTVKYYSFGVQMLEGTHVWDLRIDRITAEDAQTLSFAKENGTPVSPSTTNNALRTLRRILSFAKKERKLLRGDLPEIPLLEENERQALMEPWIEDLILEFAPPKYRDSAIIMLDTYMRPNELCRIRWDDVRWSDAQIYIPTGKTRSARRFVGMSDRVEKLLRARKAEAKPDDVWVFPSKRAKCGHMLPSSLDKMWGTTKVLVTKAIKERRLPSLPAGLVPYSARHTGLTNFNMESGDLARTARVAGHADIRTTQKYLHPATSDHAETVNRINKQKARLRLVDKSKGA
jgi:integrase